MAKGQNITVHIGRFGEVHKMDPISILIILAIFVALPILLLKIRDAFWEKQTDPAEVEEELARRFQTPQTDKIELRTGKKVPLRLVRLYQEIEKIDALSGIFTSPKSAEDRWVLAWVNPLDDTTLENYSGPDIYSKLTGTCFAFADDGCGNCFYVPLAETETDDAPVYFYYHETDESELVCSSLNEFLKWPRTNL